LNFSIGGGGEGETRHRERKQFPDTHLQLPRLVRRAKDVYANPLTESFLEYGVPDGDDKTILGIVKTQNRGVTLTGRRGLVDVRSESREIVKGGYLLARRPDWTRPGRKVEGKKSNATFAGER